jgi:hypothetical protein
MHLCPRVWQACCVLVMTSCWDLCLGQLPAPPSHPLWRAWTASIDAWHARHRMCGTLACWQYLSSCKHSQQLWPPLSSFVALYEVAGAAVCDQQRVSCNKVATGLRPHSINNIVSSRLEPHLPPLLQLTGRLPSSSHALALCRSAPPAHPPCACTALACGPPTTAQSSAAPPPSCPPPTPLASRQRHHHPSCNHLAGCLWGGGAKARVEQIHPTRASQRQWLLHGARLFVSGSTVLTEEVVADGAMRRSSW